MKVCGVCGEPITTWQRLARYEHMVGGARVELMDSAVEVVCARCDEQAVIIPNLLGLVAAVAIDRAQTPIKLVGRELKFLRKTLGLPAKGLADLLEVKPETVSRWESDKQPVSPSIERFFRVHVVLNLKERAPAMDPRLDEMMIMKLSPFRGDFDQHPRRFMLVKLKRDGRKDNEWDDASQDPLAA